MGQSLKKGKHAHAPDSYSKTDKSNNEIKRNEYDLICKLTHSSTDCNMSVFCENDGQIEVLVNGFMRDIERIYLNLKTVPMEINQMILEFCKFDFKWSPYTFFNDDVLKVQYTPHSKFGRMLAMDYVLSLDKSNHKCFEWEMKVQDYVKAFVAWRFGFIEHPISDFEDWDNEWLGSASYNKMKHYLVHYFTDFNQFKTTGIQGKSLAFGEHNLGFKKGDIVRLLVNIEKCNCSLSINGKDIGVAFTLFSGKLVPIIACYDPITLLCTKFGFIN